MFFLSLYAGNAGAAPVKKARTLFGKGIVREKEFALNLSGITFRQNGCQIWFPGMADVSKGTIRSEFIAGTDSQ